MESVRSHSAPVLLSGINTRILVPSIMSLSQDELRDVFTLAAAEVLQSVLDNRSESLNTYTNLNKYICRNHYFPDRDPPVKSLL